MIAGLRGSLLSHDALARTIPRALAGCLGEDGRDAAHRSVRRWLLPASGDLGPTAGPRVVFDRVAAPLARALGYDAVLDTPATLRDADVLHAWLLAGHAPLASMLVLAWGGDADAGWRAAVRHGLAGGVRWCAIANGTAIRLLDAERTYSRRFAEIDLRIAAADAATFAVLWGLLRADALRGAPRGSRSTLDRAIELCERHRGDVRASLQHGVHDALTHLVTAFLAARPRRDRRGRPPLELFDESLVVVYRVLFLLFAEARGLVPRWHPVYRDGYTIESLRAVAESRQRPRGVWEALQAIARLAHRGCDAGTLRVPPFNGRLFSPSHAPLADAAALDDGAVRNALVALTTRRSAAGVERIAYADLGVEQLGGVYERVLDFEPAVRPGGPVTLVPAERRKATGSFYTPRALTEYLVRRTLAPLVRDADPERILRLRVLDPAMGSGAFLVAACRYLAAAYEAALVRDGCVAREDVDDRARAGFRRVVAQRCLFGVDLNPMAVQLARLSLWLATLASDKPLTFLDHHLRTGNSLLGASLADVVNRPGASPGRRPDRPLPLFDDRALDDAIAAHVGARLAIAHEPGDTIEQIRAKERSLSALDGDGEGAVARWKRVADLWCARWFVDGEDAGTAVRMRSTHRAAVFGALADAALGRASGLPGTLVASVSSDVAAIAARERFFHWTLEFPEVFFAPEGAGFDAILGNPPWEMLRGDRGDCGARRRAGDAAARLTAFARGSGVYPLQSGGHANLFQLFVERALSLLCRGGRVGLVLPSGFATDHGCAPLRRHVLDRTRVDTLVTIENRDGLFPIHRSLRFVLLCAESGGRTARLRLRGGIRSAGALERLPEAGADGAAVIVERALVERFTGGQLAIPDFRDPLDVAIVAKIVSSIPALGDAGGWHVRFGRELNATDDRRHFTANRGGLPVVEGKHLQPFAVNAAAAAHRIPRAVARRLLDGAQTFERPRLAYRDVASATNRQTLIAAIVPAGVVTTHTLFCLKDALDDDAQRYLCGVFNSFVANYLVRLRVTTHVTTAIVERLAVPVRSSPGYERSSQLTRALMANPCDFDTLAELNAVVARMYGLTDAELEHVLSTFPLIDSDLRARTLRLFVGRGGGGGAAIAEATS